MISDEAPISNADREAILATAADYIESWIDGDAERMAGALHPLLAKRGVELDPSTGDRVLDSALVSHI